MEQVQQFADALTLTAALVVALVGVVRGWWVPGYAYKNACDERDRQTKLAEQAMEVAERLTR